MDPPVALFGWWCGASHLPPRTGTGPREGRLRPRACFLGPPPRERHFPVTTSTQWHLVRRPHGEPVDADFSLVEAELGAPAPGQVLVRNTFLSVDPYMRGRMNDAKSYVPPFALDAVMDGGAVGEVVASGSDKLQVGDTVLHQAGWRTHALLSDRAARKIDTSQV